MFCSYLGLSVAVKAQRRVNPNFFVLWCDLYREEFVHTLEMIISNVVSSNIRCKHRMCVVAGFMLVVT